MIGGHIGAAPRQDTAETVYPLKLYRCWNIWFGREQGVTLLARRHSDAAFAFVKMMLGDKFGPTPRTWIAVDQTCVDLVKETDR